MATPLVIETIRRLITQAVEAVRLDGVLQLDTLPEIQVERPGNSQSG